MLAMERAAVPVVLLKVTGCDALVVPRFWLPNVRLGGEAPATGANPVPLKATVCMLPAAPLLLSVKVRVAGSGPVAFGVNVTLTVQLLFGVTGIPVQVS